MINLSLFFLFVSFSWNPILYGKPSANIRKIKVQSDYHGEAGKGVAPADVVVVGVEQPAPVPAAAPEQGHRQEQDHSGASLRSHQIHIYGWNIGRFNFHKDKAREF